MRILIACSGGADSVALLRTLLEHRDRAGLVLTVAHMHHGIRGTEADGDEAFVRALANEAELPFRALRVDTPAHAKSHREGLEESARHLRYAWFWELLSANEADAVVTAHTLDDQAETVLHRLLRGAWTEGLSGVQPVLESGTKQHGRILRPFLETTRLEIEEWLKAIGQPWREDTSNRDTGFTRNRIRHELLPALAAYNPAIKRQFAQLAALALDEESYWQGELARLLPSLLLPGKAVRGGGRATGTLLGDLSISIEMERLRSLHPAMRRRVLRAAAAKLGASLDFDQTERLLALAGLGVFDGRPSASPKSRLQLPNDLNAERTPRELRIFLQAAASLSASKKTASAGYTLPVPGIVEAPAFGLRLEAALSKPAGGELPAATVRGVRPGDRVTPLHSRTPMKIAEVFRRARLPVSGAPVVLEWQGEIVWIHELTVETSLTRETGLTVTAVQSA
jgi:tRNA(Ile)-lysidine synthase